MSETTSTQTAGSCGPACEGESLIIEVMGQRSAEGHSFQIFDESDNEQQEWLENQVSREEHGNSQLHVWPWKAQPARNIWLDIEAEDGAPVRVPLFEAVSATERQMENQWNRILPLVPLTLVHDPEPEPGQPKEHLVPARPGFIYVFRRGHIWRELEVRYSDSRTMEFLDVRLTDYRNSEESDLTEDRRPAIGKPQHAIWTPVSEMNRSVLAEFQMAFSEVQWSSRRVAYLEASDSARAERCQGLKGPEPAPEVASQLRDRQTPGHLISLSQLPEMRLREPYLEQLLPKPWSSVYDLRGQYAKNLYGQAREEAQAFAADKESAEEAWEAARYRDAPLRRAPAARAAAFMDETSGTEKNALWQTLESSEDILAVPREKGYSGIILEDRLFHLRHRLTEALEAQRFLTSLLEAIGQKPHSDSAQVVYRLMAPERLGGQANPLHRHLEEIDTSRFSPLHTHLLTAQRQLAREALVEAQKQLANLVRQTNNQVAMADLFSLSGADYLEGFALTQDLFHVLAIDPNSVDHLARSAPTSEAQVRDANDLVLKIVGDGSDQPLHAMLFPPEQPDGIGSAVTGSGANGKCGDGRCRPTDLKQLPDQPPQPNELQTLTAAALAGLAKTDAIDLSSEAKRWMAGVGAILDGIDKHARALANRLKSQAYRLDSRLYGPLLRMAKARDPAVLGSVQMVARNAVPQGWIILGLRDPASGLDMGLTEADREYAHKANGHRRFYGEYLDADGNPLASTQKSAIPDLADTAEARRIQVYAAPETSEVVRAQRDMRRLKRWDELFSRVRVPYLVLVFEGHNIWSELSLFKTTLVQKGGARAVGGSISAVADLIFAGTIAAERLSMDLNIWGNVSPKLSEKAFQTTSPVFRRALPSLARAIPEIVTKRLLGGIVTAGLTITVSLLDMAHEWDTGDMDTAAAYGASAVGGGMMLMGGLMMAKMTEAGIAPILLGLGPWGWVVAGATLAIGAGSLAVVLDDPPLVDWLKRGPFGPEQDDAYPHLAKNPQETYYRLVDLLARPRITIEKAHNMSARLAGQGYNIDPRQDREFANINTVVKVENNLTAILNEASLTVAMRAVQITRKPSRRGLKTQRETLQEPPKVVLEQSLHNGKAYYLALPPRVTFKDFRGQEGVKTSEVLVRAQWNSNWDYGQASRNLVFPAPELHDPATFDLAAHGEPDFSETDQLFWADEQTHQSEEAK
ncbi:hypothetical protein [Marinobacter psychrophilus]|jgi:hypothetical protein|uniref:hypothetical protein n=1 Tax=Marinobacter psychrophilus TaxID=330734 RepID=UPI001B67C403|nr:hypothetical protein [Marinobacter psychrophilus]MBQ0762829.1 hypothetical protein [Marinobacter psychrophilus]MBQ0845668.1 hypothetical protein [Marinobacter psychrophilus]